MIRLLWLLILALVPAGCGSLPPLVPAGDVPALPAFFVQGRWQLVHAIEATYPDGRHGLLVGVTILSSAERAVDCTLMTVEGFVLLQASDAGRQEIRRAVPPFDRPGFAAGLLADVRLILLAPAGTPAAGRTVDGRPAWRYRDAGGQVTDIVAETDGWRLERLDARGRRQRGVTARAAAGDPAAAHITLQAYGPAGYRLDLNLISATRLGP